MILNEDYRRYKDYIENDSVNLIFADAPYGVTNLEYDKKPFDMGDFWDFCKNTLKKDGVVVVTCVISFAVKVIESAPKGWFRYDLIWEKTSATGHLNAKKRPMRAHEIILVFSPSGSQTYNPQMTHGHERKVSSAATKMKNVKSSGIYNKADSYSNYDSTDRYPRSVQRFASDKQKSSVHPNQKPIALLEWIIKTYSNEGDVIVDPVSGSGITEIAAMRQRRKSICFEINKDYFDKSIERVKLYENH